MRKLATVVLLVALVAQIATGSRLVHFCPSALATVAQAASSLDAHQHTDHGHLHFGSSGHHLDHATLPKRSSAEEQSPTRLAAPAYPVVMQGNPWDGQPEGAQCSDSSPPDRHDCAIFSAGKLANANSVGLIESSLEVATNFSLQTPGLSGWFVTEGEVTCAQWPRPPTVDLSPPRSLERLASLCRFLL